MIKIHHLTKIYTDGQRELRALDDVSLHIKPGEIFGIIGLSGAGKSTLVRCINMLERPQEGQVLVNGIDMTALSKGDLRKARQKIGMIFSILTCCPSDCLRQCGVSLGDHRHTQGGDQGAGL